MAHGKNPAQVGFLFVIKYFLIRLLLCMEDYKNYIRKTAEQRLVGGILFLVLIVGMFVFGATVDRTAGYTYNSDFAVNFQD